MEIYFPGITTVVRMLDSLDQEIQCIGCECVKILLNSDKFDYHPQLLRKGITPLYFAPEKLR